MTDAEWTVIVFDMNTRQTAWPARGSRLFHQRPGLCGLLRARYGWGLLAASIAIYVAVGLLLHQPFHESARALRYFDLKIYRGAAQRVISGGGLYATPIHDGLGFTYPPFAALVFAPLAEASITVDAIVVTVINLGLLVWLLARTLLLASARSAPSARMLRTPALRWSLAAALAAAAVWFEPVCVTLGYGQVNLLIAALVVGDLSRPDHARGKGIGIGLAAALKLTPLIFIPYLLLSGRRRAGAMAAAVFAATIGVAYAVLPAAAARYWGGRLFMDSSRIGGAADTANQSLRGLIARATSSSHPTVASFVAIAAVAALGLALAVRASRRGDEATGFSLAALSALLASPISWTHHWTLAVPALVLLAFRAHELRSRSLAWATVALTCIGYSYWPEWIGPSAPHGPLSVLTSNPYVLVACLALLGAATAPAWRTRRARTRRRDVVAPLARAPMMPRPSVRSH